MIDRPTAAVSSDAPSAASVEQPIEPHKNLRADALKLPELMMQGITHIAPAMAFISTVQFISTYAGVTTPLAYGVGFFIVLILGLTLTQLASEFPSAGGYYTYISRTVHPRAGFLTAWLYFLYDPVATAITLAFVGAFLERTLMAEYGIFFPWWVFLIISVLFITAMIYRGVELSAHTMMILAGIEITIMVVLGVTGLLHPGRGGLSFSSFLPQNAPSVSGLAWGIFFSVFAFTGFESVAPMAEESEHPRRDLPRAILGSIIFMGCYYLFCSWAMISGWGTDDVSSFSTSSVNPVFPLGRRLWGGAWFLVVIALLNSGLAASIACTNAATRVFFAMGRSGSLPAWLSAIHPKYQTPVNAIKLQTFLTLAIGLGLGFLLGAEQEYFFMAFAITLGLVFIYSAGNLGVFLYYRRERRDKFNLLLHAIFPFISTVLLWWIGYKSTFPLPAAPIRYAPLLVAVWMLLGLLLVWLLSRTGKEEWLLKAGEVAYAKPQIVTESSD